MSTIASVFKAPLKASLENEPLFNAVIEKAREFNSRPDNMLIRTELKLWCKEMGLPQPTFPVEPSPFIPLHEALALPEFKQWLTSKQIKWHEHLGLNQFHFHCSCKMDKKELLCVGLDIEHELFFKMIIDSIKYRGQLFAWNKRLQKCLPSKIVIEHNKIILIQTFQQSTYVNLDIGVRVNEPTASQDASTL